MTSLLLDLFLHYAKPLLAAASDAVQGTHLQRYVQPATRNKKRSASVSELLKLLVQKTFSSSEQVLLKFRAVSPLLIRPTISSPRELLTYLNSSGNNSPSMRPLRCLSLFKPSSHFIYSFPIKQRSSIAKQFRQMVL